MTGRSARGGSAALWTGLLMCGLALTGTVASALLDPGPVEAEPGRSFVVAGEGGTPLEECTFAMGARVSDPDGDTPYPESGELTPWQAAAYERRLREELRPMRGQEIEPPHTVQVVVHVISAEDGRGEVTDMRIDQQVEVLNAAYGGEYGSEGADTGFRFELADVTRTANDTWFTDFGDHRDSIRAQLRQGDADTLNVYTADLGAGLLGYSTFPQDYEENPEQDGVVLAHDTLPGSDRENFDLGHTGTHEIGHWLGLFHTFQNGCSTPGDYIDDTPYEREAASGCPEGRDTCTQRQGDDPVNNFMNYSYDSCMTHFTEGQARRMVEHWAAFRS